jgi:hypothetical protein
VVGDRAGSRRHKLGCQLVLDSVCIHLPLPMIVISCCSGIRSMCLWHASRYRRQVSSFGMR